MKIERFQYFVEVARLGNLTAAARKCYISQTAMSQQMDALEEELGIRLLERTRTGTSLTAAGRHLLPKAEALLACYQDILYTFTNHSNDEKELTVFYTGPLEQQLLLQAVPAFHRLHEDVDVKIRQRPMADMAASLENGSCDIALAVPGEVVLKGYRHIAILQKPICAAVSECSPLAQQESLTIEALKDFHCILLRDEACTHVSTDIRQWLLSFGWTDDRILYADTIENQLLMVNLNQGITFVPAGRYPDGIRIVPFISPDSYAHKTEAVLKELSPPRRDLIRLLQQEARRL